MITIIRPIVTSLFAASVLVLTVAVGFGSGASAQSSVAGKKIFQVGTFDRSSSEFRGGAPKEPVVFIIGQSDPAKNWWKDQPAPRSAQTTAAQVAAAPRTIRFRLPDNPAGSYRLHVALILENRAIPALAVDINGKTGLFYLQSGLSAKLGSMDDSFETAYVPADVFIDFPARYLHRGVNSIALQPMRTGQPVGLAVNLNYDAIELDSLASVPVEKSAQIAPTIFYQRNGSALKEIVDVFLRHDTPVRSGNLDLVLGSQHYKQSFKTSYNFGDEKFEFAVPEFSAETRASLAWTINGRKTSIERTIDPQKKWTVYLVPHIHLDIGYSDYQAKVAAIQSRAMDEAMDFVSRTPDFHYSVDGGWVLDQYWKTHTPAARQRLVEAMRKGQIYVPAEYANLLTGFPTAETLIRSLYYSADFSREHGTPFNYANITDVPSYSWSYASILASAGLHSLIAGPNGHETRAPVLLQGRLNENSPFWWQGPDGQKVLFWYARHYWQMGILFGVPPEVPAGRETLPMFLAAYEHPGYRSSAVLVFGSQQENTDLFPQQATFAQAWNSLYAYPHMQYSGFHDALESIAAPFHGDFPTIRGDGGPYWEDGIASDAKLAAVERRNESRAPAAEQLATLTALVNPGMAADEQSLDRMWTDMVLMDEHTWTSHNSVSDPESEESLQQSAVKRQYAVQAASIADFVVRNSMATLADAISAGRNHLIVFNTLNWKRGGIVAFDLNRHFEIVDPSTNRPVPVEVAQESKNLRRVRFLASNIPANGYKVYELCRGEDAPAPLETSQSTVLENAYYRVTLDPESGAVKSIFDKQLHRDLVDQQSPYHFGQYLYVTGGDRLPNTLLHYRLVPIPPPLEVTGAHSGRLIDTVHTPLGWVARMESTDVNTPAVTTEIRLFDHEKKIEFIEDIDKKKVTTREAVYFAFPFAMRHPQFQYEIQTGVVDPSKDIYPGAGHEWFSVQHWVSVQQDGVSATVMPLDADLVTLGDIYRGYWPDHFGDRPGSIFSFAMNNYWSTNYEAGQGGHTQLRYVITSALSTQPATLSRMGWEEATALEKDEITRQDKALDTPRLLNGAQGSFLDVHDPNLLLESWKPAEDGVGMILRFLDLGGAERTVAVKIPLLTLSEAEQTDAVERNLHPLPLSGAHSFSFRIHPHEIVTVRLIGRLVSSAGAGTIS